MVAHLQFHTSQRTDQSLQKIMPAQSRNDTTDRKPAYNQVDGLSDEVRGTLFTTPQAWPPCVRELRSSPLKNAFPKSILSRGHTGRFIILTVFVDPIQALRYTHETPGICMFRIYSQSFEVLTLSLGLIPILPYAIP